MASTDSNNSINNNNINAGSSGSSSKRVTDEFYNRNCEDLAKHLIGKLLVRIDGEKRLSGMIVEVEAYLGIMDKASHTYEGKQTEKNRSMYLPYGHSYIYKSFKGHNDCFNITSNESGAAVLIRAIAPIEGFEEMKQNRITMNQLLSPKSRINPSNITIQNVCSGPARMSHALNLTREEFDGIDLKSSETVFLEDYEPELPTNNDNSGNSRSSGSGSGIEKKKAFKFGTFTLVACPRINIDYAEEWADKLLRFCLLERRGFLSYQIC